MRNDNELLRAVEQIEMNEHRLNAWRNRYFFKFGRWPEKREPVGWPWHQQRKVIDLRRPAHSNCTVYKFPHHRRQFCGSDLPGPGDAA